MASLPHDLGAYLREQRQSARLSLRQLAEVAEVSNPYLSQIERGLKKPSAEILQSLAKGLRISAESLYVRAGILDERDLGQVSMQAAILAEPVLSERQKRVLLDIYESFRAENARAEADTDTDTDVDTDTDTDIDDVTADATVTDDATGPDDPHPADDQPADDVPAGDDVDHAEPAAAVRARPRRKRAAPTVTPRSTTADSRSTP